jgi:hypothetical protein
MLPARKIKFVFAVAVALSAGFAVLVILSVLASDPEGTLVRDVVLRSASPQEALQQFYSYRGAEDMLMDPLILAGDEVVTLVKEKVKDKQMVRRRYAIGFLGNGAYREALPELQGILQDHSERDIFRGDALEAIYMIDSSFGLKHARNYQQESNYLGQVANDILLHPNYFTHRRSYFEALMGAHD